MIVFIKPRLMESVVFQATRENARVEPEYRKEFSACYDESDPDRRESAFRAVHERWFEKLGFRARLLELLAEFKFVLSQVTRLVVADVIGARRQGIELFGAPGRYNVVISICPSFLLNARNMSVWAHHELQHIDDMLDPSFGFDKSLAPGGPTDAARNLHRDRYALLWAISIDGRANRLGLAPKAVKAKRRVEFARAFGFDDARQAEQSFANLWDSMLSERPTHSTLLELARDGLANRDEKESRMSTPIGGAACPLCKFPTFDWVPPRDMPAGLAVSVQSDFERWNPEDGICIRCAEIYRPACESGPNRRGFETDPLHARSQNPA